MNSLKKTCRLIDCEDWDRLVSAGKVLFIINKWEEKKKVWFFFGYALLYYRMSSWQRNSRRVHTHTHTHLHQQGLHNIVAAVKKQSFNLNNQSAVTNQTFHLRRRRRRLDNQSILFLSSFFSMCYIDIYIYIYISFLPSFFFVCFHPLLCHTSNSRIGITFPHQPSVILRRRRPSPPFLCILKESKSNTRERGQPFWIVTMKLSQLIRISIALKWSSSI